LDWMADLETTYGLVGKIRALAFGQVDNKVLLAIGVDDKIHLWDPLQGSGETQVFDNESRRVNALAFAELDGRPVLVVASSYDDQVVVVRNMKTGEQIGQPFPLLTYVDSIAMGLVAERLAIVGSGNGQIMALDFHSGEPIPPPDVLQEAGVCAVSELEGRVVAHVVRGVDHNLEAWVVDVATGADVWPDPMPLDGELSLVAAGYSYQEGFIITGYIDHKTIVTWSPKERKELHRLDAGAEFDVAVRALAVAEVDMLARQKVVALGPDYDSTTLVKLCQIKSAFAEEDVGPQRFLSGPQWLGPEIKAVFALDEGKLRALTDSPIAVHDLTSDGRGRPLDSDPEQATVAFAITGRRDSKAVFVADDGRVLWKPPGNPKAPTVEPWRVKSSFRLDKPAEWPRSAWAWGQVGDNAVVATGSIHGAAWIWDPASGRPIAGPLATVSPHILEGGWSIMGTKPSTPCVESLALGRHPDHGDIIAVAIDGRVRIFSLPDGKELSTPTERATVITSVALGRIRGEDVLITGSMGGVLIVWGLATGTRIAALTLDKGIDCVWCVHGTNSVAVKARAEIYVLDVVPGTESP
jgi:WD40 repeat protein